MAQEPLGERAERRGGRGVKADSHEVDPARSALMVRVGSRNTTPELRVRRLFHRMGLRYRLHPRDLPGKPDIVFASRRLAVFVHGCFWHRHLGCASTRTPKSRVAFWKRKFAENVARDERVWDALLRLGWSVLVVWECETRKKPYLLEIGLGIKGLTAK
jgi:DNA mismatch endonuclease (patch repair protein)